MDGRVHTAAPRPVYLHRLGSIMAQLHNHVGQWHPPPGFVRMRWNWETFFGDTMVYGGIGAADVWDLLPGPLRRSFDLVASRMERVMTELDRGSGDVGLIHADLHLDNALFWRDQVRIIDFDDCGFGYWLYDIAVALWELRHRNDYEQFRAALFQGYSRHRPLPAGLAHLDDFIATREVAFGLWFTGHRAGQPRISRRPRRGAAEHQPLAGHPARRLDPLNARAKGLEIARPEGPTPTLHPQNWRRHSHESHSPGAAATSSAAASRRSCSALSSVATSTEPQSTA
jgi:Ser/Thr protein kinase RdoA (MazF antagonist)